MPVQRWSPSWPMVAGTAAAGLVLAYLAVGADPAGRLLAILGAGLLLVTATRDAVLRPTLAVDLDGVTLVVGLRRRRLPWTAVTAVRSERTRRRLAISETLEIDTDTELLLLSRWRLGADPDEVATAVESVRQLSRRAG